MVAMAEVVRITDQFCDRRNPDSIDRQGKLSQVAILVLIFYCMMGIAFIKMQEMERKHPRIIHDVDVSFEFTAPPPVPTFKVGELPKPISLTEGQNVNPGSEAAPSAAKTDTVALPTIEAPKVLDHPTQVQAQPKAARKVVEAAPTAVVSTNETTAAPSAAVRTRPDANKDSTVAGVASQVPTSGAPTAGGSPDGQGGGSGTGGEGTGGTGTTSGDPGAGTGFGLAGSTIATKLENTGRAMGNIAPYRKEMLIRIAQNWHPRRKSESIIVLVTIDHEGKLLSDEILQSSGNKKSDKEALAAIEATEYTSLPDWYKGDQLQFKINLDKVEALQNN
jgi:TonB family protein